MTSRLLHQQEAHDSPLISDEMPQEVELLRSLVQLSKGLREDLTPEQLQTILDKKQEIRALLRQCSFCESHPMDPRRSSSLHSLTEQYDKLLSQLIAEVDPAKINPAKIDQILSEKRKVLERIASWQFPPYHHRGRWAAFFRQISINSYLSKKHREAVKRLRRQRAGRS